MQCSCISSGLDFKEEFWAPWLVCSLAKVASAASGRGQEVFRTRVMRYQEAHEHAQSCQDRNEYGSRRLLARNPACHGGVMYNQIWSGRIIQIWSCRIIMTFCFCKKICIRLESKYKIICELRHMLKQVQTKRLKGAVAKYDCNRTS